MIPLQFALRRRMMMINASKELPISSLPLGTLIRIAGSDGGNGAANYEIADINNLVPGGVVLVRKSIHSTSEVLANSYSDSVLDNLIKTTIYNEMPQQLRDKMMDVSFELYSVQLSASENITRKMFALTHTMVGFGNNNGVAEGKALQLYTSNASRVKTLNGSADFWRLSSQAFYAEDYGGLQWQRVSPDGSNAFASGGTQWGVVPAFVIPSETPYNATPNTDGSYNLFRNAPISDLPLGTLIRIADSDGGEGAANYEIADINNFVSGGVVLVRKNIHSKSAFGSSTTYPGGTLDNKMTSIYNSLPEKLQSKIMDATFALEGSGSITCKVFALTYTMAGFGANNGTTEGKALQHYNSDANRIKEYSGSADGWWLSSRSNTSYSRLVGSVGNRGRDNPSYSYGVVPAFVIPSNTLYSTTPNQDGSYNLFWNTPISDFPPIGTPLSDWTWEQIVALSNSGRDPQNYFSVGDEKDLILTTGEVVPVVIGDFYHNTITGTSTKAPIAFTFKNCLNTKYAMNSSSINYGGWNDSEMRTSRMSTILSTFPAELIADGAIKYVDVLASAGGKSTSLVTSSDRLRLHSIAELGLSYSSAASGEGTKYAYYTSGNRVKTVNGAASIYRTRSPYLHDVGNFCCVSDLGRADYYTASYSCGVACCFDI